MSDAEVIATALVAMRLFGDNFASARPYLESEGHVPRMLSKSQFNRRLHRVAPKLKCLFLILARVHKTQSDEDVYLVDSFPVPVCDNIRISRCRLYPLEATGGIYRGYIATGRRFFYGLKIHLIVTAEGHPVEVVLAPGAEHDAKALKQFDFNLPEEAVVYGDKACNDYDVEDLLEEAAEIDLLTLRKKNSKRAVPAYVEYLQHTYRKRIETAGSNIEKKLPASIHAVTAEGFELKVFLFVLALSFDGLIQHTTWVIIPRSEELPPHLHRRPSGCAIFLAEGLLQAQWLPAAHGSACSQTHSHRPCAMCSPIVCAPARSAVRGGRLQTGA